MNNTGLQLVVPRSHPCYADHFPGNPLVPGALLLQWIAWRVEVQFQDITVTGIKLAKFLHAVLPGDTCRLNIVHHAHNNMVTVECRRGDTLLCHCKMNVSSNLDASQ